MGTADQQTSKEDELKINLQFYNISHPGFQCFLGLLEPDVDAFLSDCLNAVKTFLYNEAAFRAPPIRSITIIVRPMDGIASTTSNVLDSQHKEIHVSADYIFEIFNRPSGTTVRQSVAAATPTKVPFQHSTTPSSIPSRSDEAAKKEIHGVLVHEMVHTIQHTGKESCPGGLIEGIADWVRLKANLAPPHWKEASGNWDKKKWDSGYETTGEYPIQSV